MILAIAVNGRILARFQTKYLLTDNKHAQLNPILIAKIITLKYREIHHKCLQD